MSEFTISLDRDEIGQVYALARSECERLEALAPRLPQTKRMRERHIRQLLSIMDKIDDARNV